MGRFLGRRAVGLVGVLLGLSLAVFLMLQAVPGDPAQAILGEKASPQALAQLRHELGLDKPWPVQYAIFLTRLTHGDLGRSIKTNERIGLELAQRFPATVELSLAAMFIAVMVGVGLGLLAALRRNSIADLFCISVSVAGVSIPIFWLGLMLILLFSARLQWLPASGRLSPGLQPPHHTGLYLVDSLWGGNWPVLWDALKHILLPALALSTVPGSIIARMTRSSMLETLGQDYIRTARAKGLSQRAVLLGHALPNALIPVLTVLGLQFGALLSGAILTETIFAWPGMGRYLVQAVQARDFPAVQGGVLLVAAMFVLVNAVVDFLYAAVDPRVRRE